MTVAELKEALKSYDDNAEVIGVDWSTGEELELTIGSNDDDEFTRYCRVSIE